MNKSYHPRREKHDKRPTWLKKAMAVVITAAVMTGLLAGCGSKTDDPKDPAKEPGGSTDYVTIETAYCPIRISAAYREEIQHEESCEGAVAVERFYTQLSVGEKELFRIYFGDAARGDKVGRLLTEDGTIWVTVAVSIYTADDFTDENELRQYQMLMDEVNTVLDSIKRADNFAAAGQNANETTHTVDLKYWKVDLPDRITQEETTVDGNYRFDFYTTLNGDQLLLYTVHVGQSGSGTLLGTYEKDGAVMNVYIEPNSAAGQIAAEEMEYALLMETINDVVQTIFSSEGFMENTSK